MAKLKIRVTPADIEGSARFEVNNPLLYALQRTTGTLWLIDECGVAQEGTPPYRSCILPPEAVSQLQQFKATGKLQPCEFAIEFEDETPVPPTNSDGVEL